MAVKPTAPTVVDPPLRSLGETEFVIRTEAWFEFEAGPFYTYIVESVDYIDQTNSDVQAAAVAANLFDLPLSGLGGLVVGVNDTEDGFEAVEITEYTVTPFAETLLDDADAATARGTLGLGSLAEQDAEDLSVGVIVATPDDDGTLTTGTYTPTPDGGNFKEITNGGAFTLAAPTEAGSYTLLIDIVNNSSAGAITLSGFDATAGDDFTTVDGDAFQVSVVKTRSGVTAAVAALQ